MRRREDHAEGGAVLRLGINLQLGAVVLQDDLHERQAQTHAGGQAGEQGVVAFGLEVRFRAAAAYVFGHADAVVADFDDDVVALAARPQHDFPFPARSINNGLPFSARNRRRWTGIHRPR